MKITPEAAQIPVRFAATKAIEGDHLILEQLKLDQNEMEMLEHIVKQMETERKLDRSAAIADMRFDFIESVCEQTVVKPKESKERIRSEKIDRSPNWKIYSNSLFCRNHGLGILSDI